MISHSKALGKAKSRLGSYKALSAETGIHEQMIMRYARKAEGWISHDNFVKLQTLVEFRDEQLRTQNELEKAIPSYLSISESRLMMLTALDGLPEADRDAIEAETMKRAILKQASIKKKKMS